MRHAFCQLPLGGRCAVPREENPETELISGRWVPQSGIRYDPCVVLYGRPVIAVVFGGKRVFARPLCLHLSDAGGCVSMDLDQQMQGLILAQQATDRRVERLDAGTIPLSFKIPRSLSARMRAYSPKSNVSSCRLTSNSELHSDCASSILSRCNMCLFKTKLWDSARVRCLINSVVAESKCVIH